MPLTFQFSYLSTSAKLPDHHPRNQSFIPVQLNGGTENGFCSFKYLIYCYAFDLVTVVNFPPLQGSKREI
jgi:hypothetical protein